jgi:glutamyl-tRNA reductase
MANLLLVGANQRTAPVAVRDRLAVSGNGLDRFLTMLKECAQIDEAVVLSTCHRTELYAASDDPAAHDAMVACLARHGGMRPDELRSLLLIGRDRMAVQHLFRVVSGTESMIIGEPQVVGQVRQAYEAARERGMAGRLSCMLFDAALRCSKRVRTETAIAQGATSVSHVAVEFARRVFGELEDQQVLVLGTGEMGGLASESLRRRGAATVIVAHRALEKAEQLAKQWGARLRTWDELNDVLSEVDIVISSTSSPHAILKKQRMETVMERRQHRRLFIIDIAVPRDVDPEVGSLYNVFLYNIDDLQAGVDENLERRRGEACRAEELIRQEVDCFYDEFQSLATADVISSFRQWAEAIRQQEWGRLVNKLGQVNGDQLEKIATFAHRLTNKLLDPPTRMLHEPGQGLSLARALQELFELTGEAANAHRERKDDSPSHEDATGT